jgi:hypothetical protein
MCETVPPSRHTHLWCNLCFVWSIDHKWQVYTHFSVPPYIIKLFKFVQYFQRCNILQNTTSALWVHFMNTAQGLHLMKEFSMTCPGMCVTTTTHRSLFHSEITLRQCQSGSKVVPHSTWGYSYLTCGAYCCLQLRYYEPESAHIPICSLPNQWTQHRNWSHNRFGNKEVRKHAPNSFHADAHIMNLLPLILLQES